MPRSSPDVLLRYQWTNGQMCFHRCTFLYCSHIFYTFSHFLLSALCLFSFSSSSFEGQPLLPLRLRVFKKNELIKLDVIHTHPLRVLRAPRVHFVPINIRPYKYHLAYVLRSPLFQGSLLHLHHLSAFSPVEP